MNKIDETEEDEETQIEEDSLDDVIAKLEEIDAGLDKRLKLKEEDAPETLGLEKKADVEIDEEKEAQKIKSELDSEYSSKKEKLNNDLEEGKQDLEDQKQKEKETSEKSVSSLNENFDLAKIKTENETLKRGLARSSIAVLGLTNIEDSRAKALSSEAESLEKSLLSLETEIVKLEKQKDSSLENLDIELADKFDEKLTSKVAELKKAQESVLEYNNKIKEQETEYQLSRSKTMSDQKKAQYEFESKYGEEIRNTVNREKFDLINSYLYKMPRTEALNTLLGSEKLAKILGDWFYQVYYVQSRR